MKYAILLGLVLISFGCSTKRPGAGTASSCSNPGYTDSSNPGHICDKSGYWRVMLAGECGLPHSSTSVSPDGPSLDCPPQFNNCIGNRCIAQKVTGSCVDASDCVSGACTPDPANLSSGYCAQPASPPNQIWFATDAIRPGVTSQSTQTNNQDYIYNIMAKGYASLDDWCMSQAQQSTIPAMRNIASWTALIIAQPDSTLAGTRAAIIVENYLKGIHQGPNTGQSFNSTQNNIYDKNGSSGTVTPGSTWGAWSGVVRNYCQATVSMNLCGGTVLNCNDDPGTPSLCAPSVCAYFSSSQYCLPSQSYSYACYNGSCPSESPLPPTTVSDIVLSIGTASNAWSQFTAPPNTPIPNYGVFVLPPSKCMNGFDFSTDCESGSTYNANGAQQKSIICLANQS